MLSWVWKQFYDLGAKIKANTLQGVGWGEVVVGWRGGGGAAGYNFNGK